jgi:dTDP-L-rhamnose 4-epimerase
VLDAAQALCDVLAAPDLKPELTRDWRIGDVRHIFAANDRARRELGFTACVDFEDGMREFATATLRT